MPAFLFLFPLLLSACISSAPAGSSPGPGVAGVVRTPDGQAAIGAWVYAYCSPQGGLRGPADYGAPVDEEGRYRINLSEGSYHLVARLRPQGGESGPPRPGDAWAVYPGNPVTVGSASVSRADFRLRPLTRSLPMRQGALGQGETGFGGRLVDVSGNPVEGAFVLGYRSSDLRRMPDFTSEPTAADGRFALYVPEGGDYCLAARTRPRGHPAPGELYGILRRPEGSGCPHVEQGRMEEVGEIVLRPFR